MVKHTQRILRQIVDELFECVWPFCELALKGLILSVQELLIPLETIFHFLRLKYRNAFNLRVIDFTCGNEKSVWLKVITCVNSYFQ